MQPGRVLRRGAEHSGDGQRGIRLGEGGHELAPGWAAGLDGPGIEPSVRKVAPQAVQENPHGRTPPVSRAGRERGPDQGAQPPVPLPGGVQDVGVDLLPQSAAGHAEDLGDLPAGEGGLPGPQEELARLPVQHDVGERGTGQPALLPDRGQPLVVHLTDQPRLGVVEHRQLEVIDRRRATCWRAGCWGLVGGRHELGPFRRRPRPYVARPAAPRPDCAARAFAFWRVTVPAVHMPAPPATLTGQDPPQKGCT